MRDILLSDPLFDCANKWDTVFEEEAQRLGVLKSAVFQSQEQLQESISNQLKKFKTSPFKAVQFTEEHYAETYYGKPPTTFNEFIRHLLEQNRVLRGYVEIATRCGYSYTESRKIDQTIDDKPAPPQERYKPSGIEKFVKPSTEPAPATVASKQNFSETRCFNCGHQGNLSVNCPELPTEATRKKREEASSGEGNKRPHKRAKGVCCELFLSASSVLVNAMINDPRNPMVISGTAIENSNRLTISCLLDNGARLCYGNEEFGQWLKKNGAKAFPGDKSVYYYYFF